MKKTFGLILGLGLQSACKLETERPKPPSPDTVETRLNKLPQQFTVRPAVARVMREKVSFEPSGGTPPYQLQVVEGKGLISGHDYDPESFSGTALIKFTDAHNQEAFALVEAASPLSIEIPDDMAPCEERALKPSGGFPPYTIEVIKNAEISADPWRVKAPAQGEYQVAVVDSQKHRVNSLPRKPKYVQHQPDLCFGRGGKVRLASEASSEWPDFFPAAVVNSPVAVAGTLFSNNQWVKAGSDGSDLEQSLDELAQSHLQAAVRLYSGTGNFERVFRFPQAKLEVTKVEVANRQNEDQLLVGGLSYRKEGISLILFRVRKDAQIDKTFGRHGIVRSEILAQVPKRPLHNLFSFQSFSRPVRIKKLLAKEGPSGGFFAQIDRCLEFYDDVCTKRSSELLAFTKDGEIDKSFGLGGRLVAEEFQFFEDISIASSGALLALMGKQESALASQFPHGPLGEIVRFTPEGKLDLTFAEAGHLIIPDPLSNDRFALSHAEGEPKLMVLHQVSSVDLFSYLSLDHIEARNDALVVTGRIGAYEELGGLGTEEAMAIGVLQPQGKKYHLSWGISSAAQGRRVDLPYTVFTSTGVRFAAAVDANIFKKTFVVGSRDFQMYKPTRGPQTWFKEPNYEIRGTKDGARVLGLAFTTKDQTLVLTDDALYQFQ